jgi:hypothetical protein
MSPQAINLGTYGRYCFLQFLFSNLKGLGPIEALPILCEVYSAAVLRALSRKIVSHVMPPDRICSLVRWIDREICARFDDWPQFFYEPSIA